MFKPDWQYLTIPIETTVAELMELLSTLPPHGKISMHALLSDPGNVKVPFRPNFCVPIPKRRRKAKAAEPFYGSERG